MTKKQTEWIPYSRPYLDEAEYAEVMHTLKSGWLSRGPKVSTFEREFAQMLGVRHAIAVNSCTSALFLGLKARGIGPGDEVITTAMTFVSTANVIIHTGAIPVFVDIDPQTLTIDPAAVEAAVTSKTKAVIPVHFAGQSCDMDALKQIAKRHHLFLLEDAAHAVGSLYKGKKIGTIGDATAFSFYATKNLTTGEGGMLTTDDDLLAERVRLLSLHGMNHDAWKRYSDKGSWYYEVLEPGYKCNMTDMQAAVGLHQLKKLPAMQARREAIAGAYQKALAGLEGITVPAAAPGRTHAWHLYVIRVDPGRFGMTRDALINRLTRHKIGTSVHFIPVPLHPYYAETFGYQPEDFPESYHYYMQAISLPLYPGMTDAAVQRVIEVIRDAATT